MKTDRELLELAAKAAGLRLVWDFDEHMEGPCIVDEDGFPNFWDPLTYDDDAFRLQVRMSMKVYPGEAYPWCESSADYQPGAVCDEDEDPDPYSATRKAIVRAAAAIGEQMP